MRIKCHLDDVQTPMTNISIHLQKLLIFSNKTNGVMRILSFNNGEYLVVFRGLRRILQLLPEARANNNFEVYLNYHMVDVCVTNDYVES